MLPYRGERSGLQHNVEQRSMARRRTYATKVTVLVMLAIGLVAGGRCLASPPNVKNSTSSDFGRGRSEKSSAKQSDYEVSQIPLPPDAIFGFAVFINNRQTVGGIYYRPTGNAATFLWSDGKLETIEKPGEEYTLAPSISDSEQTLFGNWGSQTEQHAGIYHRKSGTWEALPDIPGKPINIGQQMNNAGVAFGLACEGILDAPTNCEYWIWNRKNYEFLSLTGFDQPQLSAMNDRGQIAGAYLLAPPFGFRAFIYEDGEVIPVLPETDAVAFGINNQGQLTLKAEVNPDELFQPLLYDKGATSPLPSVPGMADTSWLAINERGDLTGITFLDFFSPPIPVVALRK